MRRMLCMFLVLVIAFTETNLTVMAAEVGNVSKQKK